MSSRSSPGAVFGASTTGDLVASVGLAAGALAGGTCLRTRRAVLGSRLVGVLEKPISGAVSGGRSDKAFAVPFVTGLADLYLRLHTP